MSNYPKVSIIITLYNYQDYILNAIESCLEQDYKGEIEVIVVDDASTDSGRIQAQQTYGNKIKLLHLEVNKGYSVAKNEGIRASSGELITTIDADDMLTEDGISSRAQIFQCYPHVLVVHAQAWIINGEGDRYYWSKRFRKIAVSRRTNKVHAQTVMVRRSVYHDYGMYDERLRSRADNEMWWRLHSVANIGSGFYYLDRPVAFYRKHFGSMVEYRKKNPAYNLTVTRILEEQKALRLTQGITRENTRFLKR
jgi:glycosyltransferase involved in cell wall biosynthesis